MTIHLIKENILGIDWSSDHRDAWTQCRIKVGDKEWQTLDYRLVSAHNPKPDNRDIELAVERGKIDAAVLDHKEEIISFFNSVKEGSKLIKVKKLATA